MRGAGGFEVNLVFLGAIVHPVQHALVFLGRQHVRRGNLHTAADRHEHEQVQRVGFQFQRLRVQHIDLMDVVFGDGAIDLHAHAEAAQMAKSVQRGGQRTRLAAETVVRDFVGAVDADGHAANAAIDDGVSHAFVDERAVGGQRDRQTVVARVRGDLENVGTKKRFAAGKHEDGFGEFGKLTHKRQRLVGRHVGFHQLLAHVETAAMDAFEVAPGSCLPEEESQLVIVRHRAHN